MLGIILFVAFFSFYMWLAFKPHRIADQQHSLVERIQSESPAISWEESTDQEDIAAGATPTASEEVSQEAVDPEVSEDEAEMEPALTEEEAIALAVETALATDGTSAHELIRPHAPAPELVEVAVRDALEKAEDFSPPEIVDEDEAKHMPGVSV